MENVPPKETIDLKSAGLQCAEWHCKRNGTESDSHSLSSNFYHKANDAQIIVWDFIRGQTRCFSPTGYRQIQFCKIIHLTHDCLFVVYFYMREYRISIIHLDWNTNKYDFINDYYSIIKCKRDFEICAPFFVCLLDNNTVAIKIEHRELNASEHVLKSDKLYIWQLNPSLTNFHLHKTISVPLLSKWFKMIDGKLFFVCYENAGVNDRNRIKQVAVCNEDGSIQGLENSEIHMANNADTANGRLHSYIMEGEWDNRCLYVLCGTFSLHTPILSTYQMFSFDLIHQKWSKINLSFLVFDKGEMIFTIHDGILSFLHSTEEYSKEDEFSPAIESFDYFLEFDSISTVYRFPIRKPETLLKLTQIKKQKLRLARIGNFQ